MKSTMRPWSSRIAFSCVGVIALALVLNQFALLAEGDAEGAKGASGSRASIEISSKWRFQIDAPNVGEAENWPATNFDRSQWSMVEAPKAWDLFDEAMWNYEGVGWYATEIDAGLAATGKVQWLQFGRVNYQAKVWLNGELLGENANGYLPFGFDVTGKLKPNSSNLLVVRVDNAPRVTWLPGAKQIEWMQYGGILEPIVLETMPLVHISDLTVQAVPDGEGARIDGTVEVASQAREAAELTVHTSVLGETGVLDEARIALPPSGKAQRRFSLKLAKANLWSPEKPNLYTLRTTIASDRESDTTTARFGVRKVETQGHDLLLNARKFVAKGVNRYDEYGHYGPRPPRELLLADLRRMKQAGVNMVRVHYPQSPELLALYDEMGFVVSEEVPINWWGNGFSGTGDEVLDEGILAQALPALERMIQRDKNHPCVIIWSMANESQTATPAGIAVMRKLIRRTKELDPTRLVTFVISTQDAKPHAAYDEADLVAVNVYIHVFGNDVALHRADLEDRVTRPAADYLGRQLKAFPNKPLLVTEFGTWGVPGLHGDMVRTEDFQAALNEAVWRAIQGCEECSGGVLWCWADYYHRRTFNDNGPFGCFGVVTVDRRPKAALAALAHMYGGN